MLLKNFFFCRFEGRKYSWLIVMVYFMAIVQYLIVVMIVMMLIR